VKVFVAGDMGRDPWELIGVFSTEELAIAACVTPTQFVGPMELDVSTPEETTVWPDLVYPLAEAVP
jgi:hypothetical protein